MKQGHVQAVIVGADRIAANGKYPQHFSDQVKLNIPTADNVSFANFQGDTANKIGTYNLAISAKSIMVSSSMWQLQ